ncbi:uncharacterized protein K441DRAFT_236201 [Cenococcum geophilum 1.58]|uniref:uncharacterized protein n=1 Tax=Cenococcum geophilum 1.58 TaxID=794803 RepID=UPI00358E10F8|nr:hypothetical protein K441DRAFT_236201 [Cenococcum geophilum 1.58]
MRIPHNTQQAVTLFLPLWATAATAISLSNFTPRINDLPSACNTVYTQTIPGCQVSDFSTNAQCSKACINGLVQISAEVNSQCANADVSETSIIGVFLLGQGIPALCNIQVTTAPATTQVKSTAAPSSSAVPSSSAAQKSSAGIIMDTSSSPIMSSTLVTSAVASSTPPAVSSAPESSTLSSAEVQSSVKASSTSATFSLASSTKSAASTKTSTIQKSNPNSGGGSPFDVQAVGNSSPDSNAPRWLAGTAALFLITLFMIP